MELDSRGRYFMRVVTRCHLFAPSFVSRFSLVPRCIVRWSSSRCIRSRRSVFRLVFTSLMRIFVVFVAPPASSLLRSKWVRCIILIFATQCSVIAKFVKSRCAVVAFVHT